MYPQKISNIQSNFEKEEQNWRHDALEFQTILQSYSNQNHMIMAEKQTHTQINKTE